MSSDCFYVRVKRVDGTNVTFDVLTGMAGGYDDFAMSRSFALTLLNDALTGAADHVPGAWDDPVREKEVARLYDKAKTTMLVQALESEGDWYVSDDWMRDNVAKYIASVTLVERRNNIGEQALQARQRAIEEEFGGTLYTDKYSTWQPRRWAQCHNYTLDVVVTDPKWASHLEVGLEYGTTAYDVWDDKRPARVAEAPKTAKKKPAKKPAAKKAAKKPAAKKAPAKKKSAKKKPPKKKPLPKKAIKKSGKKKH